MADDLLCSQMAEGIWRPAPLMAVDTGVPHSSGAHSLILRSSAAIRTLLLYLFNIWGAGWELT
jgi:hypothetical protein